MKSRVQNLLRDRKMLYMILGIILVSVFSLTIVYAALSAVLTISGNADVVSSSWDIKFSNVILKSGSATTEVPVINGNTLSFNTTLTTPGDFYEFTVDVVNNGTIDAIIQSVEKLPELTSEEAKYIRYIVEYDSGLSIASNQKLSKNSFVRLRVKIGYRNDVSPSDLPTTNTSLSLSLRVVYSQYDGVGGTTVNSNGTYKLVNVVSGTYDTVGSEICIDRECFYVVSSDNNSVTMLSRYNLYVGYNYIDEDNYVPYGDEATGIQDSTMLGTSSSGSYPRLGTTIFGTSSNIYAESVVKGYVDNYALYLSSLGVSTLEARLLTYNEAVELGCVEDSQSCSEAPSWLVSTTYWVDGINRLPQGYGPVYTINRAKLFRTKAFDDDNSFGVRPVIVISKDYFN